MRRTPAVAGLFYPAQPEALKAEVARLLLPRQEPQPVKAVVSPHAGLGYSGAVAGAVYGRIDCPAVFLMLGPNHRGVGEPVALMAEGEWETPLGAVAIDREVAAALRSVCPLIRDDAIAHAHEHSLEVQLPFLQMLGKVCHIVPLVLGLVPYEVCQELAHAVAQTVQRTSRAVVIVASTDMTHCGHHYRHLPPAGMTAYAFAYQEDRYAIDRMLALDPKGLYQVVRQRHITMCGFVPTTVALLACQELGATSATLVRYMTSGDISGDLDTVVGYAGLCIR
ncbi:MAG: AmmeMemoRadiSam system protein B [Candidatus Entotheonellia bacterium]